MDSFDFDNVEAENEDAVWRYNMERKLRNGLRLIGLFLVLFFLSCSWFPTLIPDTVEVVGIFRRRFISSFNNPLFIFVVVNIIVVVVYVLSSQKQIQKQTTSLDSDIYHENFGSHRSIPTVVPATEETLVDKKIVLVENAVVLSPVKQQCSTIVDTVTKTKHSCRNHILSGPNSDRIAPITPNKKNGFVQRLENNCHSSLSTTKEYRRTRSIVSESRSQRVPGEFRRSDTVPPRKSVVEMSSEEFELVIDSFIAENKKTQMLEST